MTKEEAIRRIKAWNLDSDDMEVLSVAIPELAESEDERIRKVLIHIVKGACSNYGIKYRGDEIGQGKLLAYLEKQKEQPTNEEMLRTLRVEYEKGVADTIAMYEQKEQKHKFKVG